MIIREISEQARAHWLPWKQQPKGLCPFDGESLCTCFFGRSMSHPFSPGSVNMLFTFASRLSFFQNCMFCRPVSALQLKLFSPKSQMTQVSDTRLPHYPSWHLSNHTVGFLSWKYCLTCFFMTTLTHDSPIFQHCPSLLTLFHLKHKLPSLAQALPGLSLLPMCFLLSRWRCELVFDCQSAFQPTFNIIKHSSPSLSILVQAPGATASCPQLVPIT